jgi:hypothetical protein
MLENSVFTFTGIFFLIFFSMILLGILRNIIFKIKSLSKYKKIEFPIDMVDVNTPYVINGKIFSLEENLVSPITLKPCMYFEYESPAFKGLKSTKLYLLATDGTKQELYSNYILKEFPFNNYSSNQFSEYFTNFKNYLKNANFNLPKIFSDIPKNSLERDNAIENFNRDNKDLGIKLPSNPIDKLNVSYGLSKSFNNLLSEDNFIGEYNKNFDNDQYLINSYESNLSPQEYLESSNFLSDKINEKILEPGQEVTVICYKGTNNNYVTGSFKNYENISIYPGYNFNITSSQKKDIFKTILVFIFTLFFVCLGIFLYSIPETAQ